MWSLASQVGTASVLLPETSPMELRAESMDQAQGGNNFFKRCILLALNGLRSWGGGRTRSEVSEAAGAQYFEHLNSTLSQDHASKCSLETCTKPK